MSAEASAVRIRFAAAADAEALAAFAARTFATTFASDNTASDMALHLAEAYGPAQQGAEIADPRMATVLAEVDDTLVAFAQLRAGPAPACVSGAAPIELLRFYVDHGWHGRGVAAALMAEVMTTARARGARTLWLGVWERNPRAIAFYGKVGFTDVGAHVFQLGTDAQTDRILTPAL